MLMDFIEETENRTENDSAQKQISFIGPDISIDNSSPENGIGHEMLEFILPGEPEGRRIQIGYGCEAQYHKTPDYRWKIMPFISSSNHLRGYTIVN